MRNKNCIIIHGCPSSIEKSLSPETITYWIPWTKKQLIEKGIETETPLMPTPWTPNYEKFKGEFEKHKVTEDTILIGHSCGCAFLVRWLGETKKKISKLILVAPWNIARKGDTIRKNFYIYPIDGTIKNRVEEIVMFTADDEKDQGKKSLKMFHQALGGQIVNLKNYGHYDAQNGMEAEEFSELIKIVSGQKDI